MRVMVLDNDRSMRELMAYALRMHGLEPIAVDGLGAAEEALAACDALMLDYQLGEGLTGAVLARRWREEGRLPPFWLVTGLPEDPEVRALASWPECREVVGKPFSVLRLAEGVRDTLQNLAPLRGGATDASPAAASAQPPGGTIPQEEPRQTSVEQGLPTDPHHSSGPVSA